MPAHMSCPLQSRTISRAHGFNLRCLPCVCRPLMDMLCRKRAVDGNRRSARNSQRLLICSPPMNVRLRIRGSSEASHGGGCRILPKNTLIVGLRVWRFAGRYGALEPPPSSARRGTVWVSNRMQTRVYHWRPPTCRREPDAIAVGTIPTTSAPLSSIPLMTVDHHRRMPAFSDSLKPGDVSAFRRAPQPISWPLIVRPVERCFPERAGRPAAAHAAKRCRRHDWRRGRRADGIPQ